MKRFIFLICLIFLFSIMFVSAGFFGDLFNKKKIVESSVSDT